MSGDKSKKDGKSGFPGWGAVVRAQSSQPVPVGEKDNFGELTDVSIKTKFKSTPNLGSHAGAALTGSGGQEKPKDDEKSQDLAEKKGDQEEAKSNFHVRRAKGRRDFGVGNQ